MHGWVSAQRWLRSCSNKRPGREIKCVPSWRRSHWLLEVTCLCALLESIQAAAERSVWVQQLFLGLRLSGNNFALVLRDGTRKPLFISGRCSQSAINETKSFGLESAARICSQYRPVPAPSLGGKRSALWFVQMDEGVLTSGDESFAVRVQFIGFPQLINPQTLCFLQNSPLMVADTKLFFHFPHLKSNK